MKKFLVALLVFATVVMAGVAFTIRFPRTTRSLRQKITRMIPQKAEPAVETPSEQNTKVIVQAEDVQVTVSQILEIGRAHV